MEKEIFLAMKRCLSASPHPGDNQHVLNSSYDFIAGEERTGDLDEWEDLIRAINCWLID